MTHERLLELVWQVNLALVVSSGAFVLYEAVGKAASTAELKSKLDLRRDQLLSSVILEIEEALRPYWPAKASRIILEPEFREESPTAFSDDARDALRNCLAGSECLRQVSKMRGLAMGVLRWDRICYWCIVTTALLAIIGLVTWFFYDTMSDRAAQYSIITPVSPAILGILSAARRQVHVHRANNAIVKEED
jgi:hypothetical protein